MIQMFCKAPHTPSCILPGTYACSSNSPPPQHNEGGPDIASFFEHKKKLALSDTESEGQGGPPPAKKTRTNGEGQKVTTTNLEEVVGDRTMVTEEATSSLAEPSRERLGNGLHFNTH